MGKGHFQEHCGNRRNGYQADGGQDCHLLQEWIWSLPMELDFHIIHKITEGRDYGTLICGSVQRRSFILSILLINYYKNYRRESTYGGRKD